MKRSNVLQKMGFVDFRGAVLTIIAVILYGLPAGAQEKNSALAQVFHDAKSELKTNEMLNTLLMIVGVMGVVAIAMWLSFRTPKKA